VTKSFVAILVLQLVGEGRLSLDDNLERWLPGLVPKGEQITVRELLNHTSGLYNYTDDLPEPPRRFRPQQLVAIATDHKPLFAPGTEFSYSNTNYILAGLHVERVTGQRLADQLEQRIFQPLGLDDTERVLRHGRLRGSPDRGGVGSLATSSDCTISRSVWPTASTTFSMAATARWVSDTSRLDRTRTRPPVGDSQSALRVSVPARRSSTRPCSSRRP